MKGFDMLPRAEKIPIDSLYDNELISEEEKEEKSLFSTILKKVFFSFFVIAMILGKKNKILIVIIAAMGCLYFIFNNSKTLNINNRDVKNTLWNRILWIYLTMFFFIVTLFEYVIKDGDEIRHILCRLLFMAILLTIVIRPIHLVFLDMAVHSREEACTEPVFAEPKGFDVDRFLAMTGEKKMAEGELVLRYYYNGENYQFVIPEDSPLVIYENSYFLINIDPEQPEHYYHNGLFSKFYVLDHWAINLFVYLRKAFWLVLVAIFAWNG